MSPGLLMDSIREQVKPQTLMISVMGTDHEFNFKSEFVEKKVYNDVGAILGTKLGGPGATGGSDAGEYHGISIIR